MLGCAFGWTFGELWAAGAGGSVVAPSRLLVKRHVITMADITFEAWLVARNARTLLLRPWALIDTEHCAPFENTLTYGVPMATMGVLGIPAFVLGAGPVGIYNFSIFLLIASAALAMYLLIVDWTGSRGAATAAALLFAFHPIRIDHLQHPSVWDIAWTVFALLFARRLFAYGRWPDAIGLAAACVLQICASFYTLLAATFVSPPFIAWLFYAYGRQKVRIAHLAVVCLASAGAVAFLLLPYAQARDTGELTERTWHYFASWPGYVSGAPYSLGGLVLVLAAIGLALGRKVWRSGFGGDPRWALLAGALLVAFVAAGPNTFWATVRLFGYPPPFNVPDPYLLLSHIIPGMDSVRVVIRLTSGVHLVACVLAGLGCAFLIRRAGRFGPAAAAGILLVVALDLFRPGFLGLEPRFDLTVEEIQPPAAQVEFATALGDLENQGSVFELPFETSQVQRIHRAVPRILKSFYHRRRTSACFGSYIPAEIDELVSISARLPEPEALAELRERDFTTIIVATPGRWATNRKYANRFKRAENGRDPHLQLVASGPNARAYDIVDSELESTLSGKREAPGPSGSRPRRKRFEAAR